MTITINIYDNYNKNNLNRMHQIHKSFFLVKILGTSGVLCYFKI